VNFLDFLAAVIVALVPVNVGITVFLFYLLGGNPDVTTLRSRAYTQAVLMVCSGIGGVFGIARFTGIHLDTTFVTVLLALLILLPSMPGIWWAYQYVTDGFE